ncbi:nucleoside diphosphate-linked moiety X motif 19 isoform X1 [Drosophila eugracilis]|uniref:nucleoside diphosphate-linked moiety X motif 19 isoform X1 n=1 Tax=Drosophila eugracilis TaxID=29029 RepID=UPI001BDA529F|nr:nucleoside diphosphate-linked moiety X motif 19 isoform X1 [Drosophila eugracilis]
MSKLLPKIRSSSSLILLSKNQAPKAKSFDYNALLLTRTQKSSFMPESSVFPGGVCDASDSSPAWLNLFQRNKISASKLQNISHIKGPRPEIFQTKADKEAIEPSLALRLTAIRETFEELGILLCRDNKSLTSTSGYGKFHDQFDRVHWQHTVHNDASQFLELCKELEVLPDVWSLHEWSAWRTPSTFKKRFETAFFMTALEQEPSVHIEPNEVKDCAWRSPLDYLQACLRKELWLPPPQFYELSRCLNFSTLEGLREFASKREVKGMGLIHPVMYKCKNGTVHLLPGDDAYPADPDASSDKIETGLSVEEFRSQSNGKLHRSEHWNQHQSQLLINFDREDGQVHPVDPTKL